MDGLTNIIAKIEEQNREECAVILNSAKEKAEKILADARLEADDAVKAINDKAKSKIEVINSKAVSSSLLEYKRVLLAKKSEILDSVIQKAVNSIADSDDKTYLGYVESLILANALEGRGVVKMSQRDACRIPADFEKKMNDCLGEDKTVEISKETIETAGGFVIEYPEIRVDCTLASLVNDKIDEIRDRINEVLFA